MNIGKILRITKIVGFASILLGLSLSTKGQGSTYNVKDLSQQQIQVVAAPLPARPREFADTSYTIYQGSSVRIVHFLVHGKQYDNIFNPNPTGLIINGKEFLTFCDDELVLRQQVNNFLDIREFIYSARKYLVFISIWENCDGPTCRYRCYNLFDITDENNIKQYSFNSIFQGVESFGEFSSDGIIDYIRAAPVRNTDSIEAGDAENYYYLTVYTITKNGVSQLINDVHANYYLYCHGGDLVEEFQIIEADWFFPVKDKDGETLSKKPYFAPYISFDPYEPHLYDTEGFRKEKRRYTIQVNILGDVEGAINECERVERKIQQSVYILPDQYSNDITFRIMVGNFASKELALRYQKKLTDENGIEGELYDFKRSW